MDVQASGVVIIVRPRTDGSFGITVGPADGKGSHYYWYRSDDAPRLGTDVSLIAEVVRVCEVGREPARGKLTVLDRVAVQVVPPPYARRIVAPEWSQRVMAAMTRPFYRYQVEGAAWMASRLAAGCGAILGDDPGLGKTAQAIAAICATRMLPAIIVCPTSVKVNWAREFTHAVSPPTIEIVRGQSGPLEGADVVILNHDLLGARKDQLANLRARCLVLDEAQAFKAPKPPKNSHRAAVATALASWIGRTIELTGTPIYNKLRDLWRLLHMADPHEWPDFELFEERYCKAPPDDEAESQHTNIVTAAGRVEHLEELQARIEPMLLRRRKHEVLQDLPPLSTRRLLVEIDDFDRRRYQQAEKDIIAWLREQQDRADRDERARAAVRAQTIVKLTTLRRLAAEAKMRRPIPDYLFEWFDRETVEPLIVFGHHKEVVFAIYGECQKILGHRVSIIGSKDSAEKRQAAVDAFAAGHTDVFIGPIRCSGVGLNGLQERGADVFFAERLWEPTMMRQGIARAHRLGQKRPVTATFMDAVDTIDEYMAELASDKDVLIAGVLGEEPNDDAELNAATRGADSWIDSHLSGD